LMFVSFPVAACTSLLVSRGASSDGSTFITYAADSHTRYGSLRFLPAADYEPGAMLDLYNYGTLEHQITIPQVSHTYQVVGFMNEHQFAMGETTWGGRKELEHGNEKGIDYGNLILLALQRAKNCREAIVLMHQLVSTYGYADGGESFSLADPEEVWIFEIVSKADEKGAVWVAHRIPDGYVSGHANQARITTFPREPQRWNKKAKHTTISSAHLDCIFEPEVEWVYSEDVVSFARSKGWYTEYKPVNSSNTNTKNKTADDEWFSFADSYNPLTFSGLRACEARVYSMFRRCADGMERYEAYVMGDPSAERLPLCVKPNRKLGSLDVMALMRDHYEGTPMDMTQDVGAGPFHCPYRWRPMEFEVDGQRYIHERAISTQQTAFSIVAQCRNWLPDKLGGVLWFGVDDTYSSCYSAVFCGVSEVPECFREGNGSLSVYSENSAFWLFNRVSNFCYLRYDSMIVDVRNLQEILEDAFVHNVEAYSEEIRYTQNEAALVKKITRKSTSMAEYMMRRWRLLDQQLLTKYIDGNIKYMREYNPQRTPTGVVKYPQQIPYPDKFLRQIVDDHGEVLKVRE